jgi:DNA-binding MarR family transcriptional regulator
VIPERESLDALQRTAWIRFAGVAAGIPAELNSRLLAESGISQFEFLVFNHLNMSEGGAMPMTRLSLLLASSLSRLSHVVSRLEKVGRVERFRSDADRRVQIVRLTERGLELFRTAGPGYYAAVRELFFDRLDHAELADLDRLMTKLLAGVDAGGILAPLVEEIGASAPPRNHPANAQTLEA